ncbi:hypothetical protein U0358_10605 [Idiomarina sp. PL1-037]|uniref:hypothetical protein n=1 Tax=Idiomarina sp. PL1-037 TaxID=3095365 RepID=UPI002ACC179C|nr:hypothetical protein [Idiomarina sp. PL1-037]WQC52482.1 hypothetical protein U0358_10605 [Idiomarina sp. PL1-037]
MEFWFPFLFGFAPVIGLALFLNIGTSKKPWKLLFGSLLIVLLGSSYALSFVELGQRYGQVINEQVGSSLLIFVSIIGGALISLALSEIRTSKVG